jgi:hypothetical protein
MRHGQFRIRTLMIAVGLAAIGIILIRVFFRDAHFHDFYFKFTQPR